MTRRPDQSRMAILVHEVRSPVAALSAIAETFADEGLRHSGRSELARLAIAACRGIERVVIDVTVASVRLEEIDLGVLVGEAAATAALGGARVTTRVARNLPHVAADLLRLRQALDNLISNALTHSGSDSEVIVGAAPDGGYVLLFVSDAGAGVPIDEQERIFEAGVRLDADRPGSGLGLAVGRAIAEAHGGTLTVESTPGAGATFTIAVPYR